MIILMIQQLKIYYLILLWLVNKNKNNLFLSII